MRNWLSHSVLVCALVLGSVVIVGSLAEAADQTDIVRTAQIRLADLGYYVGRYDGEMGPVTRAAISDFQRRNNLAVSGTLSPDTFDALARRQYAEMPTYTHPEIQTRDLVGYNWDPRWTNIQTAKVPSRFASVNVTEHDYGSMRHYAVTVNGAPVLIADNQPYVLRVSSTYALEHEDAVIFTAYQGDGFCPYKNYIVTIKSDGTTKGPTELGNCTGRYEAHIANNGNNTLLVSFPQVNFTDGLSSWDVWRYEDGNLLHV